ncbi:MAG: hypothetical protein ACR2P2_09720 [Nakamurella sp.]
MARARADQHDELLGIYLNDHLAGASAGAAMFQRAAKSARGESRVELLRLTAEVGQDRQSLLGLMSVQGVRVRRYKVLAGWVAEKAGRLKLNGSLVRRSPLSDLMELEALLLGVKGKAAGFRTLRSLSDRHSRLDAPQLDQLIDRAERQAEVLERLRIQTAQRVLDAS